MNKFWKRLPQSVKKLKLKTGRMLQLDNSSKHFNQS